MAREVPVPDSEFAHTERPRRFGSGRVGRLLRLGSLVHIAFFVAATLFTFPVLVFVLIVQGRVVGGLTAGSVKG